MDVNALKERIARVNTESTNLNKQRQINIGKSETLKKQLAGLVAQYKDTYGVDISTKQELDLEIQRVFNEKQAEVEKIEHVLGLIREGKYTEAEQVVTGGQVNQNEGVVHAPDGSVSGVVPEPQPVDASQPVAQQVSQPVAQQVSQPVAQQVSQPVAQQVSQPDGGFMNMPEVFKSVTHSSVQEDEDSFDDIPASPSAPVNLTPKSVSMPSPVPDIPTPVKPPVFGVSSQPSVPVQPVQPVQSVQKPKPKPELSGLDVGAAPPNQNSFAAILGGTAFDPNK